MVTHTGLLSLNVHEALNFDGTPICLHPDLFSSVKTTTTTKQQQQPSSVVSSSTTTTNDGPQSSSSSLLYNHAASSSTTAAATISVSGGGGGGNSSVATTIIAGNHHHHHRLMINPTMSSDDGGGSGTATSATATMNTAESMYNNSYHNRNRGIQVGDLIEIRVWDSLTTTTSSTSLQPPHVPVNHIRSMSSNNNNNNRSSILRERVGHLHKHSSNTELLRSSSSQQSVASSSASVDVEAEGDASSEILRSSSSPRISPPNIKTSVIPMKAVATTTTTTSLLLSKPPIQRRAVTTNAIPQLDASTTTTKGTTVQQLRTSSRHVRDISDMTIDTDDPTTTTSTTTNGGSTMDNTTIVTNSITTSDQSSTVSAPVVRNRNNSVDDTYFNSSINRGNDDYRIWNNSKGHNTTTTNKTHQLRLSFTMIVTEKTLTSLKGSARTQISILRPVADLYQLSSYDIVSVHLLLNNNNNNSIDIADDTNKNHDITVSNDDMIARHNVGVDFLLVTIKDQFMSRGDMHYFQNSIIGHWIYQGQRLYESTRGFQANAREIRRSAASVLSGIVTSKTVITFRSRSSRIIWLVQISSEMWEYGPIHNSNNSTANTNNTESVCEIYFDKWIAFIHQLFTKWKELEATHALTVVFFSRTFLGGTNGPLAATTTTTTKQQQQQQQHQMPPRDVYGRYYEDHFGIVLENETCADWHKLVVRIKEAFVRYPSEVGWTLTNDDGVRKPSTASHGNVLEAVNVTLNLLQFHYLDRDLQRTGNSIVVVSAGNGVFEVNRNLSGITYQRMMDNGIGSDMLCLGLPALHIAPFFLYSNPPSEAEFDRSHEQYYEVPHWMHLSFVSYESEDAVFVDHLHDPKESKSNDDAFNDRHTGIQVAPNGFVLSSSYRKVPEVISSPLLQPTSRVQQSRSSGRQLIDGRDFQDILDACRPRNVGTIPSALQALLRMSDKSKTVSCNGQTSPRRNNNLEEWGALKFEEFQHSFTTGATRGPSVTDFVGSISSVQLSISPQRSSSLLNTTSSFDSQVTSTYKAFSDDHSYSNNSLRPRPVAQLQRSGSITLDADNYVDKPKDKSAFSTSGISSDEDEIDEMEENSKLANMLRTMMRNHDSTLTTNASPKIGPKIDHLQKTEIHAATSQVSVQDGVGAALNQYRISNSRNFVPSAVRGNTMLSRTTSLFETSGTTGQASLRRIADMESNRLSPLILPPAMSSSSAVDNKVIPPETIPLQRRLIRPQEYSMTHKNNSWVNEDTCSEVPKRNDAVLTGMPNSVSRSPPKLKGFGSPPKSSSIRLRSEGGVGLASPQLRIWQRVASTPQARIGTTSRRKKIFNPFRQNDEDEVLEMKSHNRRRWSHVFPLGEVEFKRHAGPNWKSLTAPAILPLSIDYFPQQQEIDHHFTTGFHNVTLNEFDHKNFSSNKDLLIEMVRQRLTQDFQVVPDDCIDIRKYRMEPLEGIVNSKKAPTMQPDHTETIRLFLSMGHILHTLTYYKLKDIIEVRRYTAKETEKNYTVNYQYLSYCQETQSYTKCRQTFSKYTDLYNWNKVDNIICGDDDREMREGMRFKRVMFGIIPDHFGNSGDDCRAEESYVAKFRRLLEYLEKLRDKDDASSSAPLSIKFVTSLEKNNQVESQRLESRPGIERTSMVRFYVQLRKGKSDTLEWMEVAIDATFDTSWTYRIMFNWLVASSGKVDSQIQLLQRRCTQYGLRLIPFPQVTVSRNVYLNPFKAPSILTLRPHRLMDTVTLDRRLEEMDYVYDGVFLTEFGSILECIDDDDTVDDTTTTEKIGTTRDNTRRFGTTKATTVMGKQFVHWSGTLFVRVLRDTTNDDHVLLVVLGNYRYLMWAMTNSKDETIMQSYTEAYRALKDFVAAI